MIALPDTRDFCDAWLRAGMVAGGRMGCTRRHGHSGDVHWHEVLDYRDPFYSHIVERLVFTDADIIEGKFVVRVGKSNQFGIGLAHDR